MKIENLIQYRDLTHAFGSFISAPSLGQPMYYWEAILNSDWLLGPIWAVGRSQRFWSFPDIAKMAYIETGRGWLEMTQFAF